MQLPSKTNKGKLQNYCIVNGFFWADILYSISNCLMKDGVWAKTFEKSDKDKIKEIEDKIKAADKLLKQIKEIFRYGSTNK